MSRRVAPLTFLLLVLASSLATAQDRLVLADGTEIAGRFDSSDGRTVRFAPAGEAIRSWPLEEVRSVIVEPPAGLAHLIETARGSDSAGIALLRSTIEGGRDHAHLAAGALFRMLADAGDAAGAMAVLSRIPAPFVGEPTAARAKALRADLLERRRAAFQVALAAAERGEFENAIRQLERHLPDALVAEDGVDPRASVLAAIDRLYRDWSAAVAAPDGVPGGYACAKCSGRLVVGCPTCDGKGTVTKTTRPRLDVGTGQTIPGKSVDVDCGTCQKTLTVSCPDCKGSGIALDRLLSAQRNSVVRLVQNVSASTGSLRKDEVLQALEKLAVASRSVEVPPDLVPSYAAGKALRDLVGADPHRRPAGQQLLDLQKAWAATAETDRLGFLIGIGLEYALARGRIEAIGPAGAIPDRSRSEGPMPVLEASAQLRALDDRWVKVVGVLAGTSDLAGYAFARSIALEGDPALSVHYYPPAGLAWMRRFAELEAIRSGGVGTIASSYPADVLDGQLRAFPAGETVELEGRLEFRPGQSPIGVLEVWAVRSLGRPVAANPDPAGDPPREEPRPDPPPGREESRPDPPRRDRGFPPELAKRSPGDLADEARGFLARAQREYVESGEATPGVRDALERARERFAAALTAQPGNRYLDDALADVEEFAARLGG